jgi:poly(hydroxyalkanoate) depolymerase family esterase
MSSTLARLTAIRALQRAPAGAPVPSRLAPLGPFGPDPGQLAGWIYAPANLRPGAALVVVLHGCTQAAAGYDIGSGWSRLADEQGFALLFPEQRRANNPNLCFNWFAPEDIGRDGGEALSIRGMIETTAQRHAIDRRRVFVTGLSAGGAMAAVMLAAYPELFAGGAVIAGLPYGVATTVPQAFDRMRGHGGPPPDALADLARRASAHEGPWPRLSVWHGTADRTVSVSNAHAIVEQWRPLHGLDDAPARTEIVAGHERRTWAGRDGRALVELNLIAAMGHGTPIGVDGDTLRGAAAPFMLDVGVSSTDAIARFWGLTDSDAASSRRHTPAAVAASPGAASPHPSDQTGALAVIHKALRAAGLMK